MLQAEVEDWEKLVNFAQISMLSSCTKRQLNHAMLPPSPGRRKKEKKNSATRPAVLDVVLAEVGGTLGQACSLNLTRAEVRGDTKPSMQSGPH